MATLITGRAGSGKSTVCQALKRAETKLQAAGIGSARLDALILLEDVTGIDRAKLLAEPGVALPAGQLAKLTKLLNRRARHEPLAYIRGFTEFYGRDFVITPAVLEPRPESESMIELLLELVRNGFEWQKLPEILRIADVGTGSGALGITAKLELPNAQVDLVEIDEKALTIAKINVDKFTLEIGLRHSDLLKDLDTDHDILLCNLPYVPDNYPINKAAQREPKLAIFGGPDGLAIYRKLFDQIVARQHRPLFILTESLPQQHASLRLIAEPHGYRQCHVADFIQAFQPIELATP